MKVNSHFQVRKSLEKLCNGLLKGAETPKISRNFYKGVTV